MSDESKQKGPSCNEAPLTGSRPVRPTRPGAVTKQIPMAPETDNLNKTGAKLVESNYKTDVEAAEVTDVRSWGGGIAASTDDATDSEIDDKQSTNPATRTCLEDIDDFIADEGLASTLDQFPESISYTFAVSDNRAYLQDRKLLFLGETDSFQAWARLKLYPLKPDEVEYLRFSFLSGTSKAERNIATLSINMYPFNLVAKKKSDAVKEKLDVLIRYVFREATGVNQPFSFEAKQIFKSALVDIQGAIETAGGADKLLNIHPPTKLPKGLSYIGTLGAKDLAESTNMSANQSSDSEIEIPHALRSPSERKVFEVPAQPRIKKPIKVKVQPKSKPKPKAAVEKKTPKKRQEKEVENQDEQQYEPRPKVKPKPKPKPQTLEAIKKVVPAKRRASEAGDEDADQYAELRSLEGERASIEAEKAEISERQANRKREEEKDAGRMLELKARGGMINKEEGRLLRDKSAHWLLTYQREHKG